MKVFLSWSGERSKYLAESLGNWLEQVLQAVEPWISTDIEKGKRWSNEISEKLKDSKVAIICLTNENLDSKWIHFEAGAIAKTDDAYVCTLLYEVSPANVQQPLSQFQNTKFTKEEIFKLIKTINTRISSTGGKALKETNLEAVFNTFWPQLEEKLTNVPKPKVTTNIRTDRELLEESLQILRNQKNNSKAYMITDSNIDEIVDLWIERYATNKKIEHNSYALKGHEEEIENFMSKIPEVKLLVGVGEALKKRIRERIDHLLPF